MKAMLTQTQTNLSESKHASSLAAAAGHWTDNISSGFIFFLIITEGVGTEKRDKTNQSNWNHVRNTMQNMNN